VHLCKKEVKIMPKKIGVYLSDPLVDRLERVGNIKNFSKFCQKCIEHELDAAQSDRIQRFIEVLKQDFGEKVVHHYSVMYNHDLSLTEVVRLDIANGILAESICNAWNKVVLDEYR